MNRNGLIVARLTTAGGHGGDAAAGSNARGGNSSFVDGSLQGEHGVFFREEKKKKRRDLHQEFDVFSLHQPGLSYFLNSATYTATKKSLTVCCPFLDSGSPFIFIGEMPYLSHTETQFIFCSIVILNTSAPKEDGSSTPTIILAL